MRYAKIELNGKYSEIGPGTVNFMSRPSEKLFRFDRFYEKVEKIMASRKIQRVLVYRREDFVLSPFGAAEEVRAALKRLVESGKEVYYYACEYGYTDFILSSVCQNRILHPLGRVSFSGIAMPSLFFKNLLDKYEVDVTFIRRDRYKSSFDMLRTEKYDEYNRKQLEDMVDGAVEHIINIITEEKEDGGVSKFKKEQLERMLEGEILTAPEALESGIAKRLCTCDDLTDEWKKEKIKFADIKKLKGRFGSGDRIVVLVCEGMIDDGEDKNNPIYGKVVGDRTMVKSIRAARKDKNVKAVVFRVNSGGGSATASANILSELKALDKKKPLVISMGPVAGSGGYEISATGRKLFALPTTVTGSIGVLSLYFNFSKLFQKHGITTDCVKKGEFADLGSAFRPLAKKEYEALDKIIEFFYDEFINVVSEARGIEPDKLRELAQGRLWLGKDAHERDLVDAQGGLFEAIEHAATLIGAKRKRVEFRPAGPFLAKLLNRKSADVISGVFTSGNFYSENILKGVAESCLSVHNRPMAWDPLLGKMVTGENDLGLW